jgi:hypothetical protein
MNSFRSTWLRITNALAVLTAAAHSLSRVPNPQFPMVNYQIALANHRGVRLNEETALESAPESQPIP